MDQVHLGKNPTSFHHSPVVSQSFPLIDTMLLISCAILVCGTQSIADIMDQRVLTTTVLAI